jgi:hypothetical protein
MVTFLKHWKVFGYKVILSIHKVSEKSPRENLETASIIEPSLPVAPVVGNPIYNGWLSSREDREPGISPLEAGDIEPASESICETAIDHEVEEWDEF